MPNYAVGDEILVYGLGGVWTVVSTWRGKPHVISRLGEIMTLYFDRDIRDFSHAVPVLFAAEVNAAWRRM
jgi:hypothetical protein